VIPAINEITLTKRGRFETPAAKTSVCQLTYPDKVRGVK
jgi:hypothetical protein